MSGNACCRLHRLPALSLGLLQLEQTQSRHPRVGTGWGQTPCSISTPYDDLTNVETAEHSFIQAELVNIVQPFLILYLKGQRQKKTTEASPKLRFILQVAAARLMAEDISPPCRVLCLFSPQFCPTTTQLCFFGGKRMGEVCSDTPDTLMEESEQEHW